MPQIQIDSETLKSLICGAVSEAMTPYVEEMAKQNGRILVLETINTQEKGLCPQNCPCQSRLNDQATLITQNTDSAKSAHHRIDGIYSGVIIIAGAITLLLNGLSFVWQLIKGGHIGP